MSELCVPEKVTALGLTPGSRDYFGRKVREAWIAWALTRPQPVKSSWLVDYDELPEADREADRQIGEAIYALALRQEQLHPRGWRCFHCDAVFTDPAEAAAHFGTLTVVGEPITDPACRIDLKQFREMEYQLKQYRGEDSDKDRQMVAMSADHAIALRREEEEGYARGMRDMRAEAAALVSAKADAYEDAAFNTLSVAEKISLDDSCGFLRKIASDILALPPMSDAEVAAEALERAIETGDNDGIMWAADDIAALQSQSVEPAPPAQPLLKEGE